MSAVNADPDGKPRLLAEWEEAAAAGQDYEPSGAWDDDFVREWLALPPAFAGEDLRGALYVGREQAPLITSADRLSSEAAALLAALLENPQEAEALEGNLRALPRTEIAIIMERLLARARQEQAWGVPPILYACIAVANADQAQGSAIAGFLIERPGKQIEPSIVPRVAALPWASDVFSHWTDSPDVAGPVKKTIESQAQSGNLTK